MLSRRLLSAVIVAAACSPVAAAQAGPRRAQFTYTFKATQQSAWNYDNRLGASDCQQAPARGAGTQQATFTGKGKVEVTTDLARNVKKANFNIGLQGQGAYLRQGAFQLQFSQRGSCAEPDVTLGTAGCGTTTSPLTGVLLFTGGKLETSGQAKPYEQDNGQLSCPFFFYSGNNSFNVFRTSDPLDHDFEGGMLGTTQRVSSPQFFKGKTVVLKGGRTQKYAPTGGGQDGFLAQSTISWKLTLKSKR